MKGMVAGLVVVLITTVFAAVVIAISFVLYVVAVNILEFSVDVVSPVNRPYYTGEVLFHRHIDGRTFLEHALMASLVKSLKKSNSENVPAATTNFLDRYDFKSYQVSIDVGSEATCGRSFENNHRAIDISADCGTPVKALCSGRQESVFGQSQKILNGGLLLNNLKGCEVNMDTKQRIFYACIEPLTTKNRNVRKGEIIGYIKQCDEEKGDGCHLHLQFVEGALGNERQPPAPLCSDLQSVLDLGSLLLASKEPEEIDVRTGEIIKAVVPLFYKNGYQKLTVMVK